MQDSRQPSTQIERLAEWLAYAYVGVLLVAEVVLFFGCLMGHLSDLFGAQGALENFNVALFDCTVLVGIAVTIFIRDSLRWTDQVKSCPKWMWRTAFGIAIYSMAIQIGRMAPDQGRLILSEGFFSSGFVLGFQAIGFCILYAVLWRGYLSKSAVAQKAAISSLVLALQIVFVIAYRAGYFQKPN